MFEVNRVWPSTEVPGASGGFTAVRLDAACHHSALYLQCSTLASTQSFAFQTAQESTGPWVTENSTSIGATANANGAAVIRVTGPYLYMRPYLNSASTGTYQFRLVAVG